MGTINTWKLTSFGKEHWQLNKIKCCLYYNNIPTRSLAFQKQSIKTKIHEFTSIKVMTHQGLVKWTRNNGKTFCWADENRGREHGLNNILIYSNYKRGKKSDSKLCNVTNRENGHVWMLPNVQPQNQFWHQIWHIKAGGHPISEV